MSTNWKGQERHIVDQWCWFQTTDAEREEGIQCYNEAVNPANISNRVNAVQSLVDWARQQASSEAEYHTQDDGDYHD